MCLDLNSSTAACAAAVLAAATSGPDTYSAAGTPTMSSVVKSSDQVIPDLNGLLSDQMPTSAPAVGIDDHPQTATGHLDSTVRTSHQSRGQPLLLDMKIPPVLGNGDDDGNNGALQRSNAYHGAGDSTQSDQSYLHDDVAVRQDNRKASMAVHTLISADMTTGSTSPVVVGGGIGAVYDYRAVGACDLYRTRNQSTSHNHQSPHLDGSSQSRGLDPFTYPQHSPPKVGTLVSSYALGSSTPHPLPLLQLPPLQISDVKPKLAGSQRQPQQSEDSVSGSTKCRPKSNRPPHPVAGAAVILAFAAAATVAESESSNP
ncbi:hypothetical protein D915_000163 [Fasciola hepatica]|uniref:Uncharacterized protein n=1 Tax=Fasciola hepatica TaxID=6192 RepID=A0A4E0S4A3_FASHE|nr:hypothetical protein D915_000163 [Fasciola hepatica]